MYEHEMYPMSIGLARISFPFFVFVFEERSKKWQRRMLVV